VLPHVGGGLDTPRSKLKTDYEFFQALHKLGQRSARRFLDEHFDAIGQRSTMALHAEATKDRSPVVPAKSRNPVNN
jgi:hypothetical protein